MYPYVHCPLTIARPAAEGGGRAPCPGTLTETGPGYTCSRCRRAFSAADAAWLAARERAGTPVQVAP